MKKNLFIKIVFVFLSTSILFSTTSQAAQPPSAPTNNCSSYDQVSQYRTYVQCILNFNNEVVNYQNQVNQYNQVTASQGGTPISGGAGMVLTPNMPQNNCGAPPNVNDIAAWNTHNNCVSTYNGNKQFYEQAMVSINSINQQFMAMQQAAQAAEAQRLAQIQANNQTSTTGTLQQVQNNTRSASKTYSVAAAVLAGYGAFKALESTQYFSACSPWSANFCVMGAVAAGMAVYYFSEKGKANGQVGTFNQSNINVCQMNNTISSTKQNCNTNDPSSPIYNPIVNNPPSEDWFDPGTGQCKSTAPKACQDMIDGKDGYKPIGNTLPKVSGSCAGANANACMAAFNQTVTQTPRGTKVSFKDKTGKEHTFYPDELRDEKSLMAAGLTAAQAKKMMGEINAAEEFAKKSLADATKAGEGAESLAFNGLGSGGISSSGGGFGDDLDAEAKKRKFKDDLKAVEEKRKPSAAGMAKDFHGDLIGSAGDDIFTMMNRRYQLKNEQDSFFTP